MKKTCALVLLAVLFVGAAQAQEASAPTPAPPSPPPAPSPPPPPSSGPRRPPTPKHVQIVVSRTKAGKPISRLPYTVTCIADGAGKPSTLRMGVEVPIAVGGGKGVQYRSVGMSIDASCDFTSDDRFRVKVSMEQSSISELGRSAANASGEEGQRGDNPMLRTFNSTFQALLRDGQSALSTAATDPVTGDDVTIDVTLNVVK